MSSTWVTILSIAGGVLGTLLTFLGGRYTQRAAVKAQRETAAIERDKVDASAYAEARQTWDALIGDLREERRSLKKEIGDMRLEFAGQQATTDMWRRRLEDLEQKRSGDRHAIHVLTVYARQLLKVINAAGLVPPPPPEGLDLEG